MEQTVQTNETAKRPTFLTVLCILSFIAAGFSIIGLGLLIGGKAALESHGVTTDSAIDGSASAYSMPGMDEAMMQAKAAASWPNIIGGILLSIIGLFGVIMMWKLKKTGYFVYVGASIVGIILPLVLGAGFGVFGTIITILFIVLYGLNLKHMR
jgi:hypothetical protein